MNLNLLQRSLILTLTFNFVSCASTDESGIPAPDQAALRQEKVLAEFESANALFDAKNYAAAAKNYDRLMIEYPSNSAENLIIFNAGLSYLQMKNCEKASARLREVIRRTKSTTPSLKVRAQLKLSDAYTCLGDDSKAITNLIEVYAQRSRLPMEMAKAEIPAKLAAAYARVGNRKTAEEYFKIAERGLIELQNFYPGDKERREALARTLFMMGNMNQINASTMSPEDYFATARALQKYLLKAVEFNVEGWSLEAANDLVNAYETTWTYIDGAKPKIDQSTEVQDHDQDPRIFSRKVEIKRLQIAQLALQNLDDLFTERIPGPGEPDAVATVVVRMKQHERKLKNYIATHIVGSSLTEQALEADAIRIAGRVLNPDPILERQANKKMPSKKESLDTEKNKP